MTYSGAHYENPSTLPCWSTCASCFRCENKGQYEKCNRCSGRHDPECRKDPHDKDDRCRCKEGILQYRLKNGRMIQKNFKSDPFKAKVMTDAESPDERDWRSYVQEQREKYDDPTFDPVTFNDGSSTLDWADKSKGKSNGKR